MPSSTMQRAVDAVTFGRRRRARAMNKRLAELDRIEFGVQSVHRRRPTAPLTAVVVLLLLVVGGVAVWESGGHKTGLAQGLTASGGPLGTSKVQSIAGAPTTTHLADRHRLLPAVTGAPSSTSYRFLYGS